MSTPYTIANDVLTISKSDVPANMEEIVKAHKSEKFHTIISEAPISHLDKLPHANMMKQLILKNFALTEDMDFSKFKSVKLIELENLSGCQLKLGGSALQITVANTSSRIVLNDLTIQKLKVKDCNLAVFDANGNTSISKFETKNVTGKFNENMENAHQI